jgi:hypothetical protein
MIFNTSVLRYRLDLFKYTVPGTLYTSAIEKGVTLQHLKILYRKNGKYYRDVNRPGHSTAIETVLEW